MWKNIAERGTSQITIWRMRFACWITKATHTLTHIHTQTPHTPHTHTHTTHTNTTHTTHTHTHHTHTQSLRKCNAYCVSTTTTVARTRRHVTLYAQWLSSECITVSV
jgi:hypothetical protein